jgi:tRNA-intron endonuclease
VDIYSDLFVMSSSSSSSPFNSPSATSSPQQSSSSYNELPYPIEAFLNEKELKIIVKDSRSQDQLRSKGFGEKENSEYLLKPHEALYLIYTKRLVLKREIQNVDFDSLVEITLKHDKYILTKFLIYRDLRSRGYVAKEGFGFGVDFRVYQRGDFNSKPAKYVVFGINEGINLEVDVFSQMIKDIGKMGKDAIIAVVERRGEIIYYKASTLHFTEVKNV